MKTETEVNAPKNLLEYQQIHMELALFHIRYIEHSNSSSALLVFQHLQFPLMITATEVNCQDEVTRHALSSCVRIMNVVISSFPERI